MPEASRALAGDSGQLAGLLTADGRRWLEQLLERFDDRRRQLLAERRDASPPAHSDESPLLSSRSHPPGWLVAEAPRDLRDRRVELHCDLPTEAMLAAMGSDASSVVLDLESSLPVGGSALAAMTSLAQILRDRSASAQLVPLVFGPRALHRTEPLVTWQENAAPAALIDAGVFLATHAQLLRKRGQTGCLRLSRLHSAEEAAFWHDVLRFAEDCDIFPPGSVKVTLAIETLPAVFTCDKLLYELRNDAVALTFDRHACLQSFIRTFPEQPQFVLPDRTELSTAAHFLHCWGLVVIGTAHRRQTSAIGPCASYLPPPDDSESRVLARLRLDTERHAHDGFDGSGVMHPALCDITRQVFDQFMPGQHQQHRRREDLRITAADLLQVKKGKITESGVRHNLQVALHGLLAISAGDTRLALGFRGETAASVDFAADQLWQWRKHATGVLDDGRIIDDALVGQLLDEERQRLAAAPGASEQAAAQLHRHVSADALPANLLLTVVD